MLAEIKSTDNFISEFPPNSIYYITNDNKRKAVVSPYTVSNEGVLFQIIKKGITAPIIYISYKYSLCNHLNF